MNQIYIQIAKFMAKMKNEKCPTKQLPQAA
jgi:hypothetical protein